MVTNQSLNTFQMAPFQGEMDLIFPGNTFTGQVDAAQATALVAGQAVKMATTSGGVPKFLALAANTDQAFGFVSRNLKDLTYSASSFFEIAIKDSVMWMTAGAAITRGANVEVVYTTTKVITSAGVNPIVGFAIDTATADGDLIRIWIKTPSSVGVTAAAQTLVVTATLAELNAGKTLIAGQTGKAITLSNYILRVNGASFAGGTNIILESTNGTPVVASTVAEAGLVTTAVLGPFSANTTLGAGFGIALGSGDGLKVVSTGTHTTATGITFTLDYIQA